MEWVGGMVFALLVVKWCQEVNVVGVVSLIASSVWVLSCGLTS